MMLKVDLHIHTVKSIDGFNTFYEIVSEAKRKKMKIIGITDHGPADQNKTHKYYFAQFRRFPEQLNGIKTLFGAELNILNERGDLDIPDKTLKNLKLVSAGLHISKKMDYTKAMLNALKTANLKIITHPCYGEYPVNIEKISYEAVKRNVLLELNVSHFRYPHEMDEEYIQKMKKMIEICQENNHKMIIGSDAHIAHEIGDDSALRKFQKRLGFKDKFIINNDIKEVKEFFCL